MKYCIIDDYDNEVIFASDNEFEARRNLRDVDEYDPDLYFCKLSDEEFKAMIEPETECEIYDFATKRKLQ